MNLKRLIIFLDLVIWGEIDYEGGHQFTNEELDFLNKNKQYFRGSSSSKHKYILRLMFFVCHLQVKDCQRPPLKHLVLANL